MITPQQIRDRPERQDQIPDNHAQHNPRQSEVPSAQVGQANGEDRGGEQHLGKGVMPVGRLQGMAAG